MPRLDYSENGNISVECGKYGSLKGGGIVFQKAKLVHCKKLTRLTQECRSEPVKHVGVRDERSANTLGNAVFRAAFAALEGQQVQRRMGIIAPHGAKAADTKILLRKKAAQQRSFSDLRLSRQKQMLGH